MAPIPNAQQASQQAARAADRAQVSANNTANKLSKWVEENRTLVIALATGTLALGGYYLYSRSSSSSSSKAKGKGTVSDSDDDEKAGAAGGAAAGSASKKKKKKGTKKKTTGATGGASSSTDTPSQRADGLPSDPSGPLLDEATDDQLAELPEAEIVKLPKEKRESLSQHLKTLGNKAYSNRQFEKAISHYTKAIAAHPMAVFYSNRAACYANLSQPQQVVSDCDEALKMDRVYVKALNRRAVAKEQLGNPIEGQEGVGEEKAQLLFDSLADFTAVAILGQFKDQTATESVERVLRKLATGKAQDILKSREPKLPSPTFVTAYLEAFRAKPKPSLPEKPSQGDETLLKAYGALEAKSYPHALTLFNEAIEQGLSNEDLEANAYNMRGTFKFVIGNAKEALSDLERSTSLRPNYVQSWVKKASVHMELSDKDAAFADFDRAIEADPSDPDIYYHRGQVNFILGEFDAAIKDYEKSTSLDDKFIFSQVQYAVAHYKNGNIGHSTAAFRKLLRNFDTSSEAYNYYGELLLDQQKFEEAMDKFDKAIEIESAKSGSTNVLPMINKALALFQWKQDIGAAEELCRQALDKDADCDVAVATLAQLSLQQGKIQDAIEYFERSAKIARTEPELINALTYENASRAQLQFIHEYPEQGAALGQMAGMM
ncbi:Tetratricopeptide TPR2 [Kalmanozyma brasiliensis GHG001]|uniref:Translocase of outer mitochondrial membrane complex, subunit TOM70/TOM72 n=1 Tax=Kalmanozyma brasiliensis (strain GHG001) TaxID=1365824 RepID=V5ES08_KALBG|nr:Tetratricopeptide TPR2 [Kalmanozyma brasiliensis GHG001]EST05723.1 Tetratricopeptide TPR2 [Kalmanozyma brasiliensis GHG001]